jgi:hypothetical protein
MKDPHEFIVATVDPGAAGSDRRPETALWRTRRDCAKNSYARKLL